MYILHKKISENSVKYSVYIHAPKGKTHGGFSASITMTRHMCDYQSACECNCTLWTSVSRLRNYFGKATVSFIQYILSKSNWTSLLWTYRADWPLLRLSQSQLQSPALLCPSGSLVAGYSPRIGTKLLPTK